MSPLLALLRSQRQPADESREVDAWLSRDFSDFVDNPSLLDSLLGDPSKLPVWDRINMDPRLRKNPDLQQTQAVHEANQRMIEQLQMHEAMKAWKKLENSQGPRK